MTRSPDHPYTPPGTRGVSLRGRPTVSVVIASQESPVTLAACLASLADQARRHDAEIIVVRGLGDEQALQEAHPTVRFVAAEAGTDRSLLRELGLAAAVGDIVALTDDDCVAAGEWLDQLVLSGATDELVVRSASRSGSGRTGEWAAYLGARGFSSGHLNAVPAAPLSRYGLTILDDVASLAAVGRWDALVHPGTEQLAAVADATHAPSTVEPRLSLRLFCRDRFIHGHAYARQQLAVAGSTRRWSGLVGALSLPLRRTWSVATAVARPRRASLMRALPLTFASISAWSLGEAWGYLHGTLRPSRDGTLRPSREPGSSSPGGA